MAAFQSKLNVAHEYLQDATIDTLMSLSDIGADFTAPESDNTLELFAGLISASLFVVGGVAGLASIGASFAGVAAQNAIGLANAASAAAKVGDQEDRANKMRESAEGKANAAAKYGRGAAAMGGSTCKPGLKT